MMDTLERIRRQFQELPPEKQEEVADFVAYLSARYRRRTAQNRASILSHAGRLKGSPNLTGDPADLQRSLRDEW